MSCGGNSLHLWGAPLVWLVYLVLVTVAGLGQSSCRFCCVCWPCRPFAYQWQHWLFMAMSEMSDRLVSGLESLWLIRIFKSLAGNRLGSSPPPVHSSRFFYGHVLRRETSQRDEAGKLPISTMSLKWLKLTLALTKAQVQAQTQEGGRKKSSSWCLNNDVITVGMKWPKTVSTSLEGNTITGQDWAKTMGWRAIF